MAVLSRYPLTRAGLVALLAMNPDRAVVAESQGERLGDYDVVVYDLGGLVDTLDTMGNELDRLTGRRIPVVALMPHERPALVEGVLAAGVADIVTMDITDNGLLDVLEHAACGRSPTRELRAEHRRQRLSERHGLTQREAEILILIGTGCSNQQIAESLYLSINSIKTYIRAAYRKIGVRTRSEAVLWVLHHAPSRPDFGH